MLMKLQKEMCQSAGAHEKEKPEKASDPTTTRQGRESEVSKERHRSNTKERQKMSDTKDKANFWTFRAGDWQRLTIST